MQLIEYAVVEEAGQPVFAGFAHLYTMYKQAGASSKAGQCN